MTVLSMVDQDLRDKSILIREDLNVPIKNGIISSNSRLLAVIPTIKMALDAGAKVMLMSHLGRPVEGQYDSKFSLEPIARQISNLIGQDVYFLKDWPQDASVIDNRLILFENVRFNLGEKDNDESLAKKIASLCDIFVMDAFGSAHRAHASTHGVARYAPIACAGPLLIAELNALERALKSPQKPVVAIVGGSKVSTKLTVLNNLLDKVDHLIPGGGIANNFIEASGFSVGKSLIERNLIDEARKIIHDSKEKGIEVHVPEDVVVGESLSVDAKANIKFISQIDPQDMILDIGPKTSKKLSTLLKNAGTILWNGPVGVFEYDQFGLGTQVISKAIASSTAFSIAGGGDTLAAIEKYDVRDNISYISTGGGAFLEFLEGKNLPAVEVLRNRASAK